MTRSPNHRICHEVWHKIKPTDGNPIDTERYDAMGFRILNLKNGKDIKNKTDDITFWGPLTPKR